MAHETGPGGRLSFPLWPLWPLWPLALAAGVLPLIATAVAFQLSATLGLIPHCNPFIDGCVSISRAARHEAPNVVFRALVVPAAVLQAACWLACRPWLRTLRPALPHGRALRAVPWLGLGAGVALVLYATALGVDGPWYRFLRRYGTVAYFGGTAIAMLAVAGAARQAAMQVARLRAASWALFAACAALPLLGLVQAWGLAALSPPAQDALENVVEWWGALAFTLYFTALAWAWRVTGLRGGAGVPR